MFTFSDVSTNLPSTWKWSFGDGNYSTLQFPSHTYSKSGVYSVKLVVSNVNGSDSITKKISATTYPQPTIDVVGVLSPMQTINFNVVYSGTITTAFWDFGNSNTASGSSVTNVYNALGTYIVNLALYDNWIGCSFDLYDTINIYNVGKETLLPNGNQATLYPNPFQTNTMLKLTIENNVTASISVVNLLGQKVLEVANQTAYNKGVHTILLGDNLSSGTYLLKITIDDKSKYIKLIKSK
jgi:chitodextrinase